MEPNCFGNYDINCEIIDDYTGLNKCDHCECMEACVDKCIEDFDDDLRR